MDNEEIYNMLIACAEKFKDPDFEIDAATECHICKVADVVLNGETSETFYQSARFKDEH